MSKVKLDLVIFGATGYTGIWTVEEMANVVKNYPGITWGVAGRNRDKLEKVLLAAHEKTGMDISNVKIIIADVNDKCSLEEMCDGVKVLVNCCGPYVFYGEQVVAAAVRAKSHVVDVSAESQFTLLLESKYDKLAKDAGVYVISSCGLASVPVDLGVNYLEQNFDGTLNSVESYLTTFSSSWALMENMKDGIIRYSSWETMIYGFAQAQGGSVEEPSPTSHPQIRKRCNIHRNMGKWCVPYVIADTFVVNRSQRHLYEESNKRPVQYKSYLAVHNFFIALGVLIFFTLTKLLSTMSFTRKMLLNYPRLCSFGFVKCKDNFKRTKGSTVYEYTLIGSGWGKTENTSKAPVKTVIANMSVSADDPAYVGTAVALLRSAVTIIYEKHNMPATGGVMTPGYAFHKTNLFQRIQGNNFKCEIKHGL